MQTEKSWEDALAVGIGMEGLHELGLALFKDKADFDQLRAKLFTFVWSRINEGKNLGIKVAKHAAKNKNWIFSLRFVFEDTIESRAPKMLLAPFMQGLLKVCILALREKGIITELQSACQNPMTSVDVYQGPSNLLDVFPAAKHLKLYIRDFVDVDKVLKMLAGVNGHALRNNPTALSIVFHVPMFRYNLQEAWNCLLNLMATWNALKHLQVHLGEATDIAADKYLQKLLKQSHRMHTLERLDFKAQFDNEVTINVIEHMLYFYSGGLQGASVNGIGWIHLPNQTWTRLDA
ncbi:hypothetical protein EIP86_001534 [Pleurotus ostreatoroseus]|nr:hypothetical protein EIP86_001534 [Pleurotus ostreatoroseus]